MKLIIVAMLAFVLVGLILAGTFMAYKEGHVRVFSKEPANEEVFTLDLDTPLVVTKKKKIPLFDEGTKGDTKVDEGIKIEMGTLVDVGIKTDESTKVPPPFEPQKKWKNVNYIKNGVWLGNWNAAMDKKFLKDARISMVLNITNEARTMDVLNMYDELGIKYHQFFIYDDPSENISKYFNSTFELINSEIDNMGAVLVHCHAGISRSSSIVIAYLMRSEKWPCLVAQEFVRTKRPVILPNTGFQAQLTAFEKTSNFSERK